MPVPIMAGYLGIVMGASLKEAGFEFWEVMGRRVLVRVKGRRKSVCNREGEICPGFGL
jgi:hypothetical protein